MAEDVGLPGGGKVSKKAAIAGVAVVVVLVIYYYAKKSSSSASSATTAASTTDQYPPDGTTGNPSDPYSTDPATGQTYGNEMAGSGTFGAYGSLAGGSGGNYDPYSGMYYDPATGQYDLSAPYTGTTQSPYLTAGGPPFASNSAWSDWVIQELAAQNTSIDTGALTNALGVYLAGQPVTAAQKTLIFDAIAIGGDPPVAGPGGYPPSVRAAQSPGPGTGSTVIVPALKGDRVENATSALASLGLKPKFGPRKTGVAYVVTSTSPAAGRRVAEGSTVTLQIAPQNKPAPAPVHHRTPVRSYPGYPMIKG